MLKYLLGFFKKTEVEVPEVSPPATPTDKDREDLLMQLLYKDEVILSLQESLVFMNIDRAKYESALAAMLVNQGLDTVKIPHNIMDIVYSDNLGVDVLNVLNGESQLVLTKKQSPEEYEDEV